MAEQTVPPPVRHDYAQRGMVEWYDLGQLLVGLQVLVWEFVGQGRAMEESARSNDIPSYAHHDDVWFDYVADVGDGWDSTFAVASLLAQDPLEVGGCVLRRGTFLLLGGDEVYPVPTKQNYDERFVQPYSAALPRVPAERPGMLAIPGNHDWYDGLVSFSRQFTQYRDVGAWRTIQSQSYFAIELPKRWWIWGMDVPPQSLVDHGQRQYFRFAAERLQSGDRVILMAAEPDWIKRELRDAEESHFSRITRELITPRGARVHLWLAGDLHHYRRHTLRKPGGDIDGAFHRITSGGGGAYLSPTHRPAKRSVVVGDNEFVRKANYPSVVTSFRLSFRNLLFPLLNWKFGIFPMGVVYWLLTWVRMPETWPWPPSWVEAFRSPGTLLWLVVLLSSLVVFADRRSPWFRWIGGLAHGVAHIIVAGLVTGYITKTFLQGGVALTDVVAANVLNFVAGMVFGPMVFGLYLLIAVNVFGFHHDHAFSSLRIPHYKHFLRLHVTRGGALEIFPIAIRRVPRRGAAHARYHLIEGPIVIRPSAAP